MLLFGFQGEQILAQPLIIAILAVPILIQVYFNSGLAYLLNRAAGEAHCVAGPSALIGASNFFELAVAAAISLFGFNSGAALATVVGVLIEVPVMLSVVKIVNSTRGWYEAGATVRQRVASEKAGGTVTPDGAVKVSISAGSKGANGTGRLAGSEGVGTWHGRGSAGECAGRWEAVRR